MDLVICWIYFKKRLIRVYTLENNGKVHKIQNIRSNVIIFTYFEFMYIGFNLCIRNNSELINFDCDFEVYFIRS